MKIFISILSLVCVILSSCESKEEVDLLVINAKAYTVDADFSTAEAFAVKEGKIVEVGSTSDLSSKYTAKETLDAEQKTILPGLIDAHAHLYNLGLKLSRVDLDGTVSYKDVISRLQEFKKNFLKQNTSLVEDGIKMIGSQKNFLQKIL